MFFWWNHNRLVQIEFIVGIWWVKCWNCDFVNKRVCVRFLEVVFDEIWMWSGDNFCDDVGFCCFDGGFYGGFYVVQCVGDHKVVFVGNVCF